MAHRWQRADARVVLEPETPHGLADFAAKIDGTPFIVECASFPNDVFDTDPNALAQFLFPFGSKNFEFPFLVTLELRVVEQTPGDFFGDVQRACKDAVRQFRREMNQVEVTADFGTVTMRRTSIRDVNTGKWDPAVRLALYEPNESGSLLGAHKNREVGEKGLDLRVHAIEEGRRLRESSREGRRGISAASRRLRPACDLARHYGLNLRRTARRYGEDQRRRRSGAVAAAQSVGFVANDARHYRRRTIPVSCVRDG